MLRLDHVVLAVTDLDAAAQHLRDEHGLDSVYGGSHEGGGTANHIVPLGDAYIELLGVTNRDLAAENAFARAVLAQLDSAGDGLFAWAVATDDITTTAKWIGSHALAMSRVRPDGVELSWRLAGLEGAMADRSLPFFIQWDIPPEDHPGRTSVQHRVDVNGISVLEISGQRTKIRNRVQGADLPIRVVQGGGGPISVTIATADGEIVLR